MSTINPTGRSAYDLLSKPTLELTDEEVEAICADLRAKRERFLAGQKDSPPKEKKAALTAEEKKALSENILNEVGNLF